MEKWHQVICFVVLGFAISSALAFFVWAKLAKPKLQSWKARLLRLAVSLVFGFLLTAALSQYWRDHRRQPDSFQNTLFPGIAYARNVVQAPRPLLIHVLIVELNTPGLGFLVTPGNFETKLPLKARTTSEFAREFRVSIAVNGDFFSPWYSNSPWDFYPRSGDPVQVHGVGASKGRVYFAGEGDERMRTLYLSQGNRLSFIKPDDGIFNAISGRRLVQDGQAKIDRPRDSFEPRTALGLDREEKRLFIVVVDGRQPNYSEGVTLRELAEYMIAEGVYSGINLDGGGSSALVAEKTPGTWEALNCPIHTRLPWRERPVGNHLGISIAPSKYP